MLKFILATFILVFGQASFVFADESKSVALILDASGSMQAKLKNGERRINAAKNAVETFATATANDVRISLWAYGHQSHRKKKNCNDIQQLTDYTPIGDNRDDLVAKARALTAQGYTPISTILERAAKDLKKEQSSNSRIVVLVSDGKETCEGDPCAVARALAEADANLVVHTIGFAVDVAARYELQCIAKQARGNYYEADDVKKLSDSLSVAIKSGAVIIPKPVETVDVTPGSLHLINTTASRHAVFDSITGKKVGELGPVTPSISLPSGIYRVQFGNAYWRGIEIKNGKATEIETAIISIPNASYRGHEIRDWETDEVIAKLSSQAKSMNLMPSTFKVMFGTMAANTEPKPGEITEIHSGSVQFSGLPVNYRSIYNVEGQKVMSVSNSGASASLLAGHYELEHNEKRYPFEIVNDQVVTVTLE